MTQVDSSAVRHLGTPLDSGPTAAQGQVEITATTPLPVGWASFCSRPDSKNDAHWYATAPYNVDTLKAAYGEVANALSHTVDADTWAGLHAVVAEQMALYESLCDWQVA